MKKMIFEKKRLLTIMLTLMLVFSLAACGGGAADEPAEAPAEAPAETPAEAPAEETAEVSVENAAMGFFAELPGIIIKEDEFVAALQAGEDFYTLDIRSADDYAAGHVVNAISAPWGASTLGENLENIPMDETVYVYCYSGQTAGQTVALMKIAGFDVKSVRYGFNLGISKVEGYESIITTEPTEFDTTVGTEIAPEFVSMISDYFAALGSAEYKNNKINSEDLNNKLQAEDSSIFVVSIRQAEDYAKGHIPTALNIPFVAGMQESFGDLPKDKTIVIYCYSGQTAGQTVGALRVLGYDAISLHSGFGTPVTAPSGWSNEGFEVVQ